MWMFLVSKIKQIVKFYFFGNSSFNNFWEYLNKISLKGMNYGEHSIHSSGEAWFLRELNNHLSNQNLLFFDVGANIGLWTSEAVNYLNFSSTVHCFEPLSLNYNILSKRFQKDSRIKLNKLGLSKENLESKIYTVARDSGMSSLYQRKLEHFGYEMENTETIKLTTLDEYCVKNNVDWIDYLKMDVEGHELRVLSSFDWRIPINMLLIENNPDAPIIKNQLMERNYIFLEDIGPNSFFVLESFARYHKII